MESKLETISLPHLPASLPIHVALFRNVQNSAFLRQQLLAGNADFEYAMIDASLVFSRAHAMAAVFRAMNDYLNSRLKSHNVHSEIVFSFNPTNNIAESFRKLGISDSTKDLLIIKVSVSPDITHDSVATHLASSVEGVPMSFDDSTLSEIHDINKIKKLYKLGALPSPAVKADPSQPMPGAAKDLLESSLIGAIALRGS
ncbi:Uncharacterized protein PECH_006034 [Penicillium ucsense]|uniref:EKC/KEOPS complex subunit CGI121 n=1 Tax=Penicillium ucsense TaxID=2839758 RepID=A0A8J8W0G1_9EURO|nr:Uncharacterized protein PECM_007462 [Penicillium ucsense]KAF7735890.1 Uncharacterized protein PECH_006034 [Penicillium ucsense]